MTPQGWVTQLLMMFSWANSNWHSVYTMEKERKDEA